MIEVTSWIHIFNCFLGLLLSLANSSEESKTSGSEIVDQIKWEWKYVHLFIFLFLFIVLLQIQIILFITFFKEKSEYTISLLQTLVRTITQLWGVIGSHHPYNRNFEKKPKFNLRQSKGTA